MEFEDILVEVGDYGQYQKNLVHMFLVPTSAMLPWLSMNILFLLAVPDHWCYVPELDNWNLTLEEQQQLIRPPSDPKCSMYNLNYTDLFSSPTWNWTIPENTSTVSCSNGWRYDKTNYENTAATQWNMYCKDSHYTSLVLTLTFVGSIIGTPLYGLLSDRVGRKPTFFLTVIIACITSVISIFMTDFTAFVVFRTINGSIMPSLFEVPFIILMEVVGPTMRTRISGVTCNLWTVGLCFLPLVAWLCRDWFILGLVTSSITVIFVVYWKFLPESPRWLLSRDRYEEAASIMFDISKKNGKTLEREYILQQLKKLGERIKKEKETNEEANVFDILRYPKLRKYFCIVTSCWVACGASYYGLQMNVPNLGGNEFVNFFLLAIVEIPGFSFSWYFMQKYGRRWCSVSMIILTGVALLVPVFEPNAGVAPSLIGKFGASAGFMAMYQQSSELYPTVLRAQGLGLCGTVNEMFTIAVPYIIYLAEYGKYIPFLIIGLVCLLAGSAASFLPETLNESLPQTVMESENFADHQTYFSCKRRRRPSCYEQRPSLPQINAEDINNIAMN